MSHEQYHECIIACQDCAVSCENCASECLEEMDVRMMTRCIQLDRTCANLCTIAMREMVRESEFVDEVCRLCAEVCDACAIECAKHEMEHCQVCAVACRQCADACRQVVEGVTLRQVAQAASLVNAH